MNYAQIVDGVVVELIKLDGVAIEDAYHADFVARCVEVSDDDVAVGWSYLSGVFTPPPPPPAPSKASLIAHAADVRWRKEVGGVTVAGLPVATDDRSKQMIIGARIAADFDADWTTQWVGADGSIYPIDAAAIVAISDAVQAHVNACFAAYASVKADIDGGIITTTAEIDAAFAA